MHNDFSYDAFLGGKCYIFQPKSGYRSGSDAVLLAASVSLKSPYTVLDVGSASGVLGVCLATRYPQLKLTCIEVQQELSELAKKNITHNNIEGIVHCGNILKGIPQIHGQLFSCVISNPPFYDEIPQRKNDQEAKACQQNFKLHEWLDFCMKHLRPKGTFYLIHRPSHLNEIISCISKKLGDIQIIPIYTKMGKYANRIIVSGTLGSKKPLNIHPGITLTDIFGEKTQEAEQIMRLGKSFEEIQKILKK